MSLLENTEVGRIVEDMFMCVRKGLDVFRQIRPVEVLNGIYEWTVSILGLKHEVFETRFTYQRFHRIQHRKHRPQ